MAKSVRSCLSEALENLTQKELEYFKANLNKFPVKKNFSNIPRGSLETADALQLSDLLVSYYCEDYAVEVAAEVLSDSNCRFQAQKLLKDTGKGRRNRQAHGAAFLGELTSLQGRRNRQAHGAAFLGELTSLQDACSSVQEPVPQISTPSTQLEVQAPGMHFIERHRSALIQRTTTVEEILDPLIGVIMSSEQYENIRIEKTSQNKMRALFSLLPGWNQYCKDILYQVLKEKRRPLIEDLERHRSEIPPQGIKYPATHIS